jgi:biopolymer transport protein ExbB
MLSLSSSDIVQLTLWVLIAFSLITWTLILYKLWVIWAINRGSQSYTQQFWAANDLDTAAKLDQESSALGRIAGMGFKALQDINNNTSPMLQNSGDIESIIERSLRQQISKERKTLEQGLSMLASIGSTAPFVGLFGTVWGIMHALQSISKAKSASLDVVAGPIGEALIATAIGIAVAIPAVLAYNFFIRRIKLAEAELEYFASDLLNLMIMTGGKAKSGDK